MSFPLFDFLSPRQLVFGPGRFLGLPASASQFGSRILLITGGASLQATKAFSRLLNEFSEKGCTVFQASVAGEPSPDLINRITRDYLDSRIDLVIAVGGGSVLDAGKAVSAMMNKTVSVEKFLEGVGTRTHDGTKLPFIAVPTTSGTGSEATKNAVLSSPGPSGYKKSLRHDNFVPDMALVDPELTLSCPYGVTAACGMDALTQLIEAYVSVKSSPVTQALCQSALSGFGRALSTVLETDPHDLDARSRLSYGAYISGLALANAGLGTVHGFAAVIGGMAANRHGEVCGTLLAETTKATIRALEAAQPDHPALSRYADAAVHLDIAAPSHSVSRACSLLIDQLFQWTDDYNMPRLSACGIAEEDIPAIAGATGQKNNPAVLPDQVLASILGNRI